MPDPAGAANTCAGQRLKVRISGLQKSASLKRERAREHLGDKNEQCILIYFFFPADSVKRAAVQYVQMSSHTLLESLANS